MINTEDYNSLNLQDLIEIRSKKQESIDNANYKQKLIILSQIEEINEIIENRYSEN